MGQKQSSEQENPSISDAFSQFQDNHYKEIWNLPRHKLKTPSDEKKPTAVLFFYGTFCPFHKGHFDTMKQAEEYVKEKLQNEVIGGYISPCHPQYLYMKLQKDAIPHSTRNKIIEIAIEDDETWMLDPFMSGTEDFVHNFQILCDFQKRVSEIGNKGLQIYWIMGTDNFGDGQRIFEKFDNFHLIVVENRDEHSKRIFDSIQKKLDSNESSYRERIHFIQCEPLNVSSTQIRKILNSTDINQDKMFEELVKSLGFPKACRYIIEKGLWFDLNHENYKRKLIDVKDIGIHTKNVIDNKPKKEFITIILQKSELIKETEVVSSFEFERKGQDLGFSGPILKIHDIQISSKDNIDNETYQLANPDTFILKMSASAHHFMGPQDEGTFLIKLGARFESPIFPKCYLMASSKGDHNAEEIKSQQEQPKEESKQEGPPKFKRGDKGFYIMALENIQWGKALYYDEGYTLEQLLSVVNDLAEFHAFFMKNEVLKIYDSKKVFLKAGDEKVYQVFSNAIRNVHKQMSSVNDLKEHRMFPVIQWLKDFLPTYFEKYLNAEPRTICHGDFTHSNVLISKDELNRKQRNCLIDWQTLFIGNGFVDLTFIMYYGTQAKYFMEDEELSNKCFELYMKCLSRHGRSSFNHKVMYQKFQQAKIFAMLRFLSGFGIMLMHEGEHELSQKWQVCSKEVLDIYNKRNEIFN